MDRKKSTVLLLVTAIVLANIAWSQNAVETSLYLSFNKNGPIAIGKIASLQLAQQSAVSEIGTLSLDITEQLRGDPLPSRVEVRFGWVDPSSSEFLGRLKGPPPGGFDRLRPVAGMHVLLMFDRRKPTTVPPLAVLDLDSEEAAWVPLIKRAIAGESLQGADRVNALLHGLNDPQKFIRTVSMHALLQGTECQSGSACADSAVTILGVRANRGTKAERLEAISWLAHQFYFEYEDAGPTSTNNKIAATILTLVGDPDPSIRGQAIDNLDQVLSPGNKWRPDLAHLAIPDRSAVVEALRREGQKGGRTAVEASRISSALGVQR
ncbi:MAG TPA: hypothetical protein VGI45_18845 [Terracidiphilus sp.]|jgi:hypothetical protein